MMAKTKLTSVALAAVFALQGCVSQPTGPRVNVMPAPNKPFAVFQEDQALCKQYADQQVAGGADSANNRALGSAVLGTVLGAGLGAAVGGGRGAAIGAGSGAVVGTAVGAGGSDRSEYSLQQRYDMAYSQCMYSRGNQVPGFAAAAPPPPPPPSYAPPPPPPGYAPPPPPPGY